MNAEAASAITATRLTKAYGTARALDGFDLEVAAGSVCGLLGPNGAGKTTAVRILTTLVRPDGGRATVAGHDVVRDATAVRRRIGLVGQHPALDEELGGRENLVMFGRLFHLRGFEARRRADALLEQYGLADAAALAVKRYSGGMRRRLDVAVSLILSPAVLFLDEPTTGLDPRGRNEVWAAIRELVRGGTSVLLTTQYLDEADQLSDRISIVDHGRVVAEGTPVELKAGLGGDRLDLVVRREADVPAAAALLERVTGQPAEIDRDNRRASAPVDGRLVALAEAMQAIEATAIEVEDLALRRPTLDEVFLQLTGVPTAGVGAARNSDKEDAR
jgi:ABC-2 type transport system ATP-binding protein